MADQKQEAVIDYTNYRGERAHRHIRPRAIVFENNEWHPETQWLLEAFDIEKGADRTFALSNIHEWFAGPDLEVAEGWLRKRVSPSYLQRNMRIAYSRADSIIRLFTLIGRIAENADGSLRLLDVDGEGGT